MTSLKKNPSTLQEGKEAIQKILEEGGNSDDLLASIRSVVVSVMAAEPNVEIQRRKRNMLTHPDSYGQTSGLIFDILNRVFVVMQILDHVLPNISSDSSVDDSNPTRFTATNITEALSKLPEDARQALERNTKWKGYLEEKDRVGIETLLMYMIVDYFYIFETLHNIPQEGQQLILSHENWKGYIIESNHHDYRHLIRTLEEWETIFREISKLPPSIQKKVKENENWIYYIIGGSNKNDPYDSSCRVKNREPYYTPLLNLIKFYQAEYPESPKLGSNSNVPTIKE